MEMTGSSPFTKPTGSSRNSAAPSILSSLNTPHTHYKGYLQQLVFLREVGSSISGHSEHCRLGPLSVCPPVASPPSPSCPPEGKQAETCGSSREAACYQHPHAQPEQPDRTMASILFTLDPGPSHSIRALTGTCRERIGLLQ